MTDPFKCRHVPVAFKDDLGNVQIYCQRCEIELEGIVYDKPY